MGHVTTPGGGSVSSQGYSLHTKFDDSSFSRSRDTIDWGAIKVKMGCETLTIRPFHRCLSIPGMREASPIRPILPERYIPVVKFSSIFNRCFILHAKIDKN